MAASFIRAHCVIICLLLFGWCVNESFGQWSFSPEETEVFDLVDEVKQNFYEFLGIGQDATSAEVRRSYRKLSLTMHPDKNKTEGAAESFRILAAMYEVLKNKEKREIYDQVLVNGLPAAYRFVPRQLRKMSLFEVSIIIALIATTGHYLIMWGIYAERKLTLDENMQRIQKKLKKQKKKGLEELSVHELEEYIVPKPKFYDILPLLLARKSYHFVLWVPEYIKYQQEQKRLLKEEQEQIQKEEEEAERKYQEEIARRSEQKRLKQLRSKQKREEMEEAKKLASASGPLRPSVIEDAKAIEELEKMYDDMTDEDFKKKKPKKDEWTEDDQAQLVKLLTKFPTGTPERWVRIAKELGRNFQEVIARVNSLRDNVGTKAKYSAVTQVVTKNRNNTKIPDDIISTSFDYNETDDTAEKENKRSAGNLLGLIFSSAHLMSVYTFCCLYLKQCVSKIQSMSISFLATVHKLRGNEQKHANTRSKDSTADEKSADRWEQNQQKLLEAALAQYPKTDKERWEKISKTVPGKTKEDCLARYRFLAKKIQQQNKQST